MALLVSTRTIEAVIETVRFNGKPPWPLLADYEPTFIRLYPGISDEGIGSVMITACLYNRVEISPTASETLSNFLSTERFILPGGLLFSEGGEVKVSPGCCCGLEDWREWLDVPHGHCTVWAGHDPWPWVEYEAGKVRVWQDEKDHETEFIELGVEEMADLLGKVESDLKGFWVRPGKWVNFIASEFEQEVVDHFAKNMNIYSGRT